MSLQPFFSQTVIRCKIIVETLNEFYFSVLIIVSWTRINVQLLIKIIFVYFRKYLSPNFDFWIRKIFEKTQSIMKIFRIFCPNFFVWNLWIKLKNSHFNSFHACIHIFWQPFEKSYNLYFSSSVEFYENFPQIMFKIFNLWFFKFLIKNQVKPFSS
jgi:hypothetical protein